MAKKSGVATMPESDDNSSAIGAVASAVSSVGDTFDSIKYKIEDIADAINNVGQCIQLGGDLADVIALSTIAQHGTDEDREAVVAKLKRGFDDLG
jgi:hypothetical protein